MSMSVIDQALRRCAAVHQSKEEYFRECNVDNITDLVKYLKTKTDRSRIENPSEFASFMNLLWVLN